MNCVAQGTAGVWRIIAINEAEGWKERTTVEDMDLAVRATLQGWKFVYVGDVKVSLHKSFLSEKKNYFLAVIFFIRLKVNYQAVTRHTVISSIVGPADLQIYSRKWHQI